MHVFISPSFFLRSRARRKNVLYALATSVRRTHGSHLDMRPGLGSRTKRDAQRGGPSPSPGGGGGGGGWSVRSFSWEGGRWAGASSQYSTHDGFSGGDADHSSGEAYSDSTARSRALLHSSLSIRDFLHDQLETVARAQSLEAAGPTTRVRYSDYVYAQDLVHLLFSFRRLYQVRFIFV